MITMIDRLTVGSVGSKRELEEGMTDHNDDRKRGFAIEFGNDPRPPETRFSGLMLGQTQ
jgi:hypothetical protein